MNTPFHLSQRLPTRQRGVALIIVLSMLVLMSALLVAFMSSVSTERTSAAAATSGFEARQSADSAVNLAISQIRQATTRPTGSSWASSPGAMWTFGSDGESVYKLYSSNEMQVKLADYKPADVDENGVDTTNERGVKAGFVDINEPILVPIPQAVGAAASEAKYEAHYPIADPRAGLDVNGGAAAPGRGIVDGFYASKVENKQGKKDKNGKLIRLLPMPVKWLYQLKDGRIEGVDGKGQIPNASKENPPISRMAFWTDDESSKVNVNTAAEGTFWDTPMASTFQESGVVDDGSYSLRTESKDLKKTLNLAAAQPARAEYQRFAGHPATTCLSPVLRWLFPDFTIDNATTDSRDEVALNGDRKFKEAIYELSPRYVGGPSSSEVASVNVSEGLTNYRITKRDRLFSTLDEYFFRPDRTPINFDGASKVFDKSNLHKGGKITQFTPDALEKLRFFLTANSRASELNLFGKPRMAIWPVSDKDDPKPEFSKRTAFDDLIAFCSTFPSPPPNLAATTKKMAYYFQRSDPKDPTADYLTAGAERNVDLYKYLQNLTTQNTPGLSSNFKAKYGDDRDQILTEIFDYIRSTNLVDTGGKADPATGAPLPKNPYTPYYWKDPTKTTGPTGLPIGAPNPGSGQVIPLEIIPSSGGKSTRGFGRFVTLSEANLLFYYDNTVLPGEGPLTAGSRPVRCVLLLEMVTPSIGYPALAENYSVRVYEGQAASENAAPTPTPFAFVSADGLTTTNMELANGQTNVVRCDVYLGPHGRFFMPSRGFGNQFLNPSGTDSKASPKTFSKSGDGITSFPFYSKRIDLPGTGGNTFRVKGGHLTIDILADSANAPLLQRLVVKFPDSMDLPFPTARPNTEGPQPFHTRIAQNLGDKKDQNFANWISAASDVSRSMEANQVCQGDTRLLLAKKFVGPEYFSPVPVAAAPGNHGHTLHDSWGAKYPGSRTEGFLVAGAKYRDKRPDTPNSNTTTTGVVNASGAGDFDRGMSKHVDGPFINKADEGNIRFGANESDNGRLPYFRGFGGYEEVDATFFSPNRLVSSPVNFGSLSTGVKAVRPWETLLFRPQPGHRGSVEPKDHYLLDLFHMPVVEPYAISEPVSCAGRVNLNCRIAPFGYLPDNSAAKDSYGNPHYYMERTTGLHAVLKSLRMMVIPSDITDGAHAEGPLNGSTASATLRYKIDRYRTIDTAIRKYLDSNKYFRSATQICEIDLFPLSELSTPIAVPDLTDLNARKSFWDLNAVTGDNMRERPYSYIYPRITTKSNVYTVHVWSQAIAKSPAGNDATHWKTFDEDRDRIVGEYRGSTTIERFLDPGDPALEKYDATKDNSESLDSYYRFRILNTKRFLVH